MKKILLGLVVLLALASCGNDEKPVGPVHSVLLVRAEESATGNERIFAGTVEDGREISVGFKTGGQIAQVLVKEGDYVHQGQLIATLDDKDYRLAVDATQIQYDQLSREVERLKKLYEGNGISGNDYDKAVSGKQQLGVSLQNNKNQLSYTRLYAPTGGYVQSVHFETSEMVGAGTGIITLLDVKQMEVWINIPASLYAQRDRFGAFTATGLFDQSVTLTPLSIIPKADAQQLYRVRLALPEHAARQVTGGQNVEVRLEMKTTADEPTGITLPVSAVVDTDGKTTVFVYNPKDSTVSVRPVQLGTLQPDGKVQVTDGLQAGEQVVKAGAKHLQDNEKVRLLSAPSDSNIGNVL